MSTDFSDLKTYEHEWILWENVWLRPPQVVGARRGNGEGGPAEREEEEEEQEEQEDKQEEEEEGSAQRTLHQAKITFMSTFLQHTHIFLKTFWELF